MYPERMTVHRIGSLQRVCIHSRHQVWLRMLSAFSVLVGTAAVGAGYAIE